MIYAETEFYQTTYGGNISTERLNKALRKASMTVDTLTFNRLPSLWSELSQVQKERVALAVCMIADFQTENEDVLSSAVSSYSINGVSMSFNTQTVVSESGAVVPRDAYSLLRSTGLTYRGGV